MADSILFSASSLSGNVAARVGAVGQLQVVERLLVFPSLVVDGAQNGACLMLVVGVGVVCAVNRRFSALALQHLLEYHCRKFVILLKESYAACIEQRFGVIFAAWVVVHYVLVSGWCFVILFCAKYPSASSK